MYNQTATPGGSPGQGHAASGVTTGSERLSHREEAAGARATDRRPAARAAMQMFLANHLILIVVALLTSTLFYDVPGRDHSLLAIWDRWDARWYVQVADRGYSWHASPQQSDLAFFPLYPLCMHLLTLISPFSAYDAGLLISACGFAVCLYLFWRLVYRDYDADTADRAVTYLGFFPTSFFFFTAYSEALYLACCLGCIYALRLRRWWVAGLCGMAAALTRQIGVLLIIPFVVEYLEGCWRERHARTPPLVPLLACALIPAGILAFVVYQQVALGDGLLFIHAQQAWGRTLALPWTGIVVNVQHIFQLPGPYSRATAGALRTIALIDLLFLAASLALLVTGARRLPRSYTAYAAAVWLAILINPATGGGQPLALLSTSRFALTIFPPLIALALLDRRRGVDRWIVPSFVALLTLFAILFIRNRWIA